MLPITHVATIGTGTIGASWAAFFLSRGLHVTASDPASDAEARLRRFIDDAWPALEALGLHPGADPTCLRFTPDPAEAVAAAHFVQESGPDRIELKVPLFERIGAAAPQDTILASSSSTLTPTAMAERCPCAERLLLGHPFNPPHLIPLVEVCGGERTAPETVDAAMAFYKQIGKHPIRLNKEIPGHVSNRLQFAIWREAAFLVEQGVVDVADLDAAICMGPGLRWALMGPIMTFHLGGGAGGLRYLMQHINTTGLWPELGTPDMTPEFREALVAGVEAEAGGRAVEVLAGERDRRLVALLQAIGVGDAPQ